jgi:hypothetical protein
VTALPGVVAEEVDVRTEDVLVERTVEEAIEN